MKTSLTYRFYTLLKKHGVKVGADRSSAVAEMQEEIASLDDGSIQFNIRTHEDGSWSACSVNVDGIITGGRDQSEIDRIIKDATLTYYGIHPSHVDEVKLRNSEEPATIERNVRVTA